MTSFVTCGLVAIFFIGAFLTFAMSKSGELSDVLIAYWPVLLAGLVAAGAVTAMALNRMVASLWLAALAPGILIFLVCGGWDVLENIGWV